MCGYTSSSSLFATARHSLAGRARRLLLLVGALVLAVGVVAVPPASGSPQDDKSNVDKKLAETEATLESATDRAKQAGLALAEANERLPGARQAAAEARGRVIAAQVQAAEAQRNAEAAEAELGDAQQKFDAAEQAAHHAQQRFNGFVRDSYEGSTFLAPAMILSANGPDDMISAIEYVDSLSQVRKDEIKARNKAHLAAGEQRADMQARKDAADEANQEAQRLLEEARSEQAAADDAERQVQDLVNSREQAQQIADSERDASQRKYDELQAESARIEEEIRAAARAEEERAAAERARKSSGNSSDSGDSDGSDDSGDRGNSGSSGELSAGGRLLKPVSGWKSSDFGSRYDPYYHRWQLHAGTDFAASGGTPIKAADDGVVVRAGWNGGYGNYTCILHGDLPNGKSLTTCYGHQSKILVSKGERVSRGDAIGRVGTTGASTGNHLHFEVRLDGVPVNPLSYL